jgi:hypothetical protein
MSTLALRNYGLVLPSNYVSIEKDEMEYIDGGSVSRALGYLWDAGVLIVGLAGMASVWAKGVGFFAGLTVKAAVAGAKFALMTGTFVGPGIVTALAALATLAAIVVPIVGCVASGYLNQIGNCFKKAGREVGLF